MLHKCVGVVVLLCIGSLVLAQDKDKPKDKGKDKGTPAEIVKVNPKAMTLLLKVDGKEVEYKATRETKFRGPRGGVTNIRDKRLEKGKKVRIIAEGKTLKELHIEAKARTTDKPKDKKDK